MSFNRRFAFFERVKGILEGDDQFGLACIRSDDVRVSGHDLLSKIHLLIERAELVIAEVSDPSPNVYYEVGYAVAKQKPILLLAEVGTEIPTDLRGLELVEYAETASGVRTFAEEFRRHVSARLSSRIALLRDLLLSSNPRPAYIVASPKYPSSRSRIKGQHRDIRTFGDNLGVRGLLSAFGSMLGEGPGVELIAGRYCAEDLEHHDLNLYIIGSKKSVPLSGQFLEEIQGGREPDWILGPAPGETASGDYRVGLFKTVHGRREWICGERVELPDGGVFHKTDYGILVRAPHPTRKNRIVMIFAGSHSLGTGAACLAGTRSHLIEEIRDKLPSEVDLEDKSIPFWVLVRGQADSEGMLGDDGVTIVDAGGYQA